MDVKLYEEIEAEIKRLGGTKGYALDGLLINIEMQTDEIRENDAIIRNRDMDMEPTPIREELLTLAAWAVMALRFEDTFPGHDIYEQPQTLDDMMKPEDPAPLAEGAEGGCQAIGHFKHENGTPYTQCCTRKVNHVGDHYNGLGGADALRWV